MAKPASAHDVSMSFYILLTILGLMTMATGFSRYANHAEVMDMLTCIRAHQICDVEDCRIIAVNCNITEE